MARIGVLTGGGDCPGLNAVIRADRAQGRQRPRPRVLRLHLRLGGRAQQRGRRARPPSRRAGILHRGGTILGTSRTNPFKEGGPGVEGVRAGLEARGIDALIPIGGEDTLGVAGKLAEAGVPVRRRPEDDRQRPRRHGLHVRLPDRGADRHRRDRPPAHDRRVAQPRDRRRGDGPPRGLDRRLLRPGRRRRRDPRPRAPVRHRGGLQPPAPPRTTRAAGSRSSSSPRARTPKDGAETADRPDDAFGHAAPRRHRRRARARDRASAPASRRA